MQHDLWVKIFDRNPVILFSSPVQGNTFMILFFVVPSVNGRRDDEMTHRLKYALHILHTLIYNLLFHPLKFRLPQFFYQCPQILSRMCHVTVLYLFCLVQTNRREEVMLLCAASAQLCVE